MIGFIGAGSIATAMLRGMIGGGIPPASFLAFDIDPARMQAMRALGIATADSAAALADAADTTVLAVKPKFMHGVLEDLRAHARAGDVLSLAVGWTQGMLTDALPGATGIVRAMPNTPTQVQEGAIALNENHTIAPDRFEALTRTLGACGRIFVVPEALFDAVTGISGSGPAYVYLFIEALVDAGVRQGLPREMAYALASQTLLGAASLVLKTKEHPGALKDAVCSPGGTTIEAIFALEKAGFRGAVMDAVDACSRKAAAISRS